MLLKISVSMTGLFLDICIFSRFKFFTVILHKKIQLLLLDVVLLLDKILPSYYHTLYIIFPLVLIFAW